MDTFRDTFVGQIIYHASGGRFLKYQEERPNFEVPARYRRDEKAEQRQEEAEREQQRLRELPDAPGYPSAVHAQRTHSDADSERTRVGDREQGDKGKEGKEDPNIVDWYSEDDPENPLNWSTTKKCFVTGCLSLITVTMYAGSSIFSPGVMSAMETFHVAQVPMTLGLSMFVLGYGIGPLFLSPISEIPAVGRTIPYILSLVVFTAVQAPTAVVKNFAGFLVLRFIAGFACSPPLATGGASISDMFTPEYRPFAMGVWGISAASGPAIGPIVSGFAVMKLGYTWSFWILLFWSAGSLLILIFTLPETSSINILVRRAQRLRKVTGNKDLKSQGEIQQANMGGMDIVQMTMIRPLKMTFTEPIVIAANLYIGFIYAILYSWFEVFPIAFNQIYGWNLGVGTLPFLSLFVGAFIGYAMYAFWNKSWYMPRYRKANGNPSPELRLLPAFVGAFCYPICLFGFGWTVGRVTPWAPIIFASFFGIGTTLMFLSILNYLPDIYPTYAASVLASNDFFRSMMGAGSPLYAHGLFVNLGVAWGSSLLGFLSIAFIPLPFLLYKFGPKLRSISKMAESSD